MKKFAALLLALVMAFGLMACGSKTPATSEPAGSEAPVESVEPTPAPVEPKGTIMWLSNLSSGAQYDASVAYMEAIGEKLGYELTVVYGDFQNDAANNLLAVQNGMSDDVVALIVSQDGGLASIMEEYPDLYVVGYNTDLRSVYNEGGENAACLQSDKFLGSMADGFAKGDGLGELMAKAVIDGGYKSISFINFPAFAYPNQGEAEVTFKAAIDAYNADAAEPITIVGETTTLMFQPLEDSFFLEEGRDQLDAIVAVAAGIDFVYPVMIAAMENGSCSADTKLLTAGFQTDSAVIADVGGEGVISMLFMSPAEAPAYSMILLDKAITGTLPADFEAVVVDSAAFVIDSAEDISNVMEKSLLGTGDAANALISVDDVVDMATNADLTWADLVATFQNVSADQLA